MIGIDGTPLWMMEVEETGDRFERAKAARRRKMKKHDIFLSHRFMILLIDGNTMPLVMMYSQKYFHAYFKHGNKT